MCFRELSNWITFILTAFSFTWGPPMTKRPLGCRWYMVSSSKYTEGTTALMIFSFRASLISSRQISSSCCTETTMVWTRTGITAPRSWRYCTVTCRRWRTVRLTGKPKQHISMLNSEPSLPQEVELYIGKDSKCIQETTPFAAIIKFTEIQQLITMPCFSIAVEWD